MQKLCMIFLSSALVVSSSCGMELSLLEKKEINLNNSPVGQLVKAKEFTIDGVIVSTLPYYDPFQLLKNDAHYFKYWISSYYNCCRREVENFLACLFMKAQHNNSCPQGDKTLLYKEWVGNKDISFFDLEQSVGKEAIDFVKEHLSGKCHQVLSIALNGNSDYKELRSIVQQYPFVLAYDKKIAFELLQCVMGRDKKTFKYLLDNKPDVSGVDENGNTLLHRAIESKNVEAIALLMKKDINLTHHNQSQHTAIDLLYEIGDKECIEVFYGAFAEKFFSTYSYQVYYQEIKKLLKEPKFDSNFCDKDDKSLLQRAAESYPEKCSILLKNGAIATGKKEVLKL